MKPLRTLGVISLGCLTLAAQALAAGIQFGEGAAATIVDRFANFDTLTKDNSRELDAYSENALSVTTANANWGSESVAPYVLNPFHIEPSPGGFFAVVYPNPDGVTIKTTDNKPIYGLEFMYGNTWTTGDLSGTPPYSPWGRGDATLEFQVWRADTMIDSGTQAFLPLATIVGFSDPAGFDRLVVRATSSLSGDNSQALALDNLRVQLTAPVPEPETWGTMLAGLGLVSVLARRRKARGEVTKWEG